MAERLASTAPSASAAGLISELSVEAIRVDDDETAALHRGVLAIC